MQFINQPPNNTQINLQDHLYNFQPYLQKDEPENKKKSR